MLADRTQPATQHPNRPIDALRRSILLIRFDNRALDHSMSEVIGVATVTYAVWIDQPTQAASIQAILLVEKEQSPQFNSPIVSN